MSSKSIIINKLSYSLPNGTELFSELSTAIPAAKVGLIGRNGLGKSTLLKLIAGEFLPSSGQVEFYGNCYYCEQNPSFDLTISGFEFLEIAEIRAALARVSNGSALLDDFALCDTNWDIELRLEKILARLNLSKSQLERPVEKLSGGERTKLMLAKAELSSSDWVLLDEPTNNLDATARNELSRAIIQSKKSFLIVSHDRSILNQLETIIELTSKGLFCYGGNYNFYLEQKAIHEEALQQQLLESKRQMKNSLRSEQKSKELHAKKKSKGRKEFLSGSVDKLTAKSWQGRSEKTQNRQSIEFERKVINSQKKLERIEQQIEQFDTLTIRNTVQSINNKKLIFDLKDVGFAFSANRWLFQGLSLRISGTDRMAITGNNGAGKTTLLKLLLGTLNPSKGTIKQGTKKVVILDQHMALLDKSASLLQNFKYFNPGFSETESRLYLADFLFKREAVQKKVGVLSGGELVRAALCCLMADSGGPDCLILDEPTNHLDLTSLKQLETALKQYKKCLIVVSHDSTFLKALNLSYVLNLSS